MEESSSQHLKTNTQQLSQIVIAVAVLITILLIFFTLFYTAKVFRELVNIQTKVESLFNNISLEYIKDFRIQKSAMVTDSKQSKLFSKLKDDYLSDIFFQPKQSFTEKYKKTFQKYSLIGHQMKQCNKAHQYQKRHSKFELINANGSLMGFNFWMIMLLIWYLACLSMSIVNKLDSDPDVYLCTISSIFAIAFAVSIASVTLTYYSQKLYIKSFQNQILKIFTYKLNDEQDGHQYRIQALGFQNCRFITKIFFIIAILCISFAICVYQLSVMKYHLKISTGVIFLAAPILDILIFRQIAIIVIVIIQQYISQQQNDYNSIENRLKSTMKNIEKQHSEKKMLDNQSFEVSNYFSSDASTLIKDGGSMMLFKDVLSVGKDGGDLFPNKQSIEDVMYSKANDLIRFAFVPQKSHSILQDEEDNTIFVNNCQKILSQIDIDKQSKLINLMIMSFTQQTYGDKAAYKILKNLKKPPAQASFEFIEKLQDNILNNTVGEDIEQNFVKNYCEKEDDGIISSDQFEIKQEQSSMVFPELDLKKARLEVVEEVSENSKTSRQDSEEEKQYSPLKEGRSKIIAIIMGKKGKKKGRRRKRDNENQEEDKENRKESLQDQTSYLMSQEYQNNNNTFTIPAETSIKHSNTQRIDTSFKDEMLLSDMKFSPQPSPSRNQQQPLQPLQSQNDLNNSSESGSDLQVMRTFADIKNRTNLSEFNKLDEIKDDNDEGAGRVSSLRGNPFLENHIDSSQQIGDDDTQYICTDNEPSEDACNPELAMFQRRTSVPPFYDIDDNPLTQRLDTDEANQNQQQVSFNIVDENQDMSLHINNYSKGLTLQDLYDEKAQILKNINGQSNSHSQDITQMTTPNGAVANGHRQFLNQVQFYLNNQQRLTMMRDQSTKTLKRVESSKIYDESTILRTYEKNKLLSSTKNNLTIQKGNEEQEEEEDENHEIEQAFNKQMNRSRSEYIHIRQRQPSKLVKVSDSKNDKNESSQKEKPSNQKYWFGYPKKFVSPLHSVKSSLIKNEQFNKESSASLSTMRVHQLDDEDDSSDIMQSSITSSQRKFHLMKHIKNNKSVSPAMKTQQNQHDDFQSSVNSEKQTKRDKSQIYLSGDQGVMNIQLQRQGRAANKSGIPNVNHFLFNQSRDELDDSYQQQDQYQQTSKFGAQLTRNYTKPNLNNGEAVYGDTMQHTSSFSIQFNDNTTDGQNALNNFLVRGMKRQNSSKKGLPPLGAQKFDQKRQKLNQSRSEANINPIRNNIRDNQLFQKSIKDTEEREFNNIQGIDESPLKGQGYLNQLTRNESNLQEEKMKNNQLTFYHLGSEHKDSEYGGDITYFN